MKSSTKYLIAAYLTVGLALFTGIMGFYVNILELGKYTDARLEVLAIGTGLMVAAWGLYCLGTHLMNEASNAEHEEV